MKIEYSVFNFLYNIQMLLFFFFLHIKKNYACVDYSRKKMAEEAGEEVPGEIISYFFFVYFILMCYLFLFGLLM